MARVIDGGDVRAARQPDPPSPRPRRVIPPSWLDLRLAIGVVLVLGSVFAGARIVASAARTESAVALRRALEPGTVLATGDLALVRARVPGLSGHGSGVYVSDLDDAVGKQLSRAVSAGELLPVGALADPAPKTTVTVPLPAAGAPDLRKGQRIEVWVSTASCAAAVLLPEVTVQAVHADSGGSFGAGGQGQDVVVSLAPVLAQRVVDALALDDVQLRAGILAGAAVPAASSLPDLDDCRAHKP